MYIGDTYVHGRYFHIGDTYVDNSFFNSMFFLKKSLLIFRCLW